MFDASGPGVRYIQKVAQWDTDFSCVAIIKQSESCDQPTAFQERSDTYAGSAPILAAHKSRGVALDPLKPVDLTHLVRVPDCTTIL